MEKKIILKEQILRDDNFRNINSEAILIILRKDYPEQRPLVYAVEDLTESEVGQLASRIAREVCSGCNYNLQARKLQKGLYILE